MDTIAAKYLERILTSRVYEAAIETPLETAPKLCVRTGNRVWLKREDQQPVFSFKVRGAHNAMAHLSPAALRRGVIAASAGNHAQGVALSAALLGCPATIVMPATTPDIKVRAVRDRGATVVLHGDSFDEAKRHAFELGKKNGATAIHPFDDPLVIAGQGTIGMEIMRQCRRPPHAIFVPVGGGGLIAGIAVYVKTLFPSVRIIGVEPHDAASMHASLLANRRVELPSVGLFADGVAVRQVGRENFRLCRTRIDEMILVSTDEICAAIKDIFEDTRSIMEPAGALAVAGLKKAVAGHRWKNRDLVALACGANMNFDRLRHVTERAVLGEKREALLAVTVPERPGSFREFCNAMGRVNITEFNYRFSDSVHAHVFVGVSIREPNDVRTLLASLHNCGFSAIDMTHNEAAILHLRHIVGGRAHAPNEVFYRFEFPERPGALANFLNAMPKEWNISLFHYRNHGTDYGRVLAGIQVPPSDSVRFERFLSGLGYAHTRETDNPALRLFLQG